MLPQCMSYHTLGGDPLQDRNLPKRKDRNDQLSFTFRTIVAVYLLILVSRIPYFPIANALPNAVLRTFALIARNSVAFASIHKHSVKI